MHFGNVHTNLKKAQDRLMRLQADHPAKGNIGSINEAKCEVNVWLEREESLWK